MSRSTECVAVCVLMLLLFTSISAFAEIEEDAIGLIFAIGGNTSIYQAGEGDHSATTYNNIYSGRFDFGYFITEMHQLGFTFNADASYNYTKLSSGDSPKAYPTFNGDLGVNYRLHTGGVYSIVDFFIGLNGGGSTYYTGNESIVGEDGIKSITVHYGGFAGGDIGINVFVSETNALMFMTSPRMKFQAQETYLTDEGWKNESINKFENRLYFGLMTLFG